MLRAKEFTVGTLADAKPLTLVLPRGEYEATVLIGGASDHPVAVFLDGEFRFGSFASSGGGNWRGVLIPDVRLEVDESTLFDAQSVSPRLGSLIRTGSQLTVCAKRENSMGITSKVVLEDGLPSASDLSAGFSRWQISIGEGRDKRVIFEVDTKQTDRHKN